MTWEFSWLDFIIFFAVILAIILIFFITKIFKRPPDYLDIKEIKKKWEEVEELIHKDSEAMWRVAIIEADKILDMVLKGMVMPGETMGQRLKVACYKYQKLRQVWWAHKLRNNIVHEAHFKLTKGQARKAIRSFRSALKTLNVL